MSVTLPRKDVGRLFKAAEAAGRVGVARKNKAVDARPAKQGEIIITFIKGEGEETRSKPARAGDMVVRNRCPETGNEEYLVAEANFRKLYQPGDGKKASAAWREFRPTSIEVRYFIVGEQEGNFVFTAPWGESMIAKSGDAIVQEPDNPSDTYRVAGKSFVCTYEILTKPRGG
ncbi:hypothetical protein GCM10007874_00210 [Labrys miyagiensis]|uniref:Uncharacterized protein n=2 Tax=Labrys miyagiensis TaxID=346912 RepID=A0ABQ6C9G5_9HYPH|nr:hypothetical protein GCM10007874_00210 [Labrys miyagiensis]